MVGKVMAMVALLLAGCGQGVRDEMTLPRFKVICPNPNARARLVAGATYRDLAESCAQAVSGWRQCHGALAITQQ